MFVIHFIGESSAPGLGEDPFWQSSHTWQDVILTTTAPTGNGSFTIDNSAWSAFGTFSTVVDQDPGIDLVWTPTQVPEPGSLALLAVTAAGAAGYSWRKRRQTVEQTV